MCGAENVAKTSSEHRSGQRGPLTQDVEGCPILSTRFQSYVFALDRKTGSVDV